MPAIPMNDAADRYSPEIADAFQPTDTARPATKKSLAVLEVFADRKPIQTVTKTVMKENAKIHGSTPFRKAREGIMAQRLTEFTSSFSSAMERRMNPHEMIHTKGKNNTPRISQVSVNPATRVAMKTGAK